MMDQPHIGYVYWEEPITNRCVSFRQETVFVLISILVCPM